MPDPPRGSGVLEGRCGCLLVLIRQAAGREFRGCAGWAELPKLRIEHGEDFLPALGKEEAEADEILGSLARNEKYGWKGKRPRLPRYGVDRNSLVCGPWQCGPLGWWNSRSVPPAGCRRE
jgi:hypothetical protein